MQRRYPECRPEPGVSNSTFRIKNLPFATEQNYWHFGGYADAPQSGPGGWNDDSGVSVAARETLKEAAGITPPSSGFVLKMLAAYLVVLVPLNWLIFRMLGRVEWAWIAAPFIAIVGALLVVKMASLDIGFVRSNTQIGLLEILRGLSTRAYHGIFRFVHFAFHAIRRRPGQSDGPIAPICPSRRQPVLPGCRVDRAASNLRRTLQNRLEGFQIQSNSTGMLHTEFMLDLEGTVSCGFDDQVNQSSSTTVPFLNIKNCGVVRRDAAGDYQVAWIGDLPAGNFFDRSQF